MPGQTSGGALEPGLTDLTDARPSLSFPDSLKEMPTSPQSGKRASTVPNASTLGGFHLGTPPSSSAGAAFFLAGVASSSSWQRRLSGQR